ncbi:O-antigen polysaccharide polymerase Wzy [Allobranchiibius sp. GilTou73]|uniref:O-antigen polysaccharide polymerase Wzy n=1 Tax=Allobranchiibius sp. GilTou73 TaxID=2904523 RepID=UPI001F372B14|nr:O-antigen polysaccharide polymerase Wzy [Allobranchiibius sp. GilTou73]UIJ36304.1 O-antigen polysaccharide polymerase Wzy family protein [Allobranchiibius sp. GilTou73]
MRKKLFRVFLAWSAIAFILGLRGEVLIPMTAYLVVRARQRPIKFRAWMAPAAVALLALGALVRTTRVQGLRGAVVNLADVNPLSSLAELGYSIRPLAQVITWQSSSELPVGSGTYTHPVLRALGGHFLNLGLPPASTDPTALNTVVAARVGNIGGSPIAEAFRAGSLPGVILVMVSLGIISGILDARRGGQLFDCLAGGWHSCCSSGCATRSHRSPFRSVWCSPLCSPSEWPAPPTERAAPSSSHQASHVALSTFGTLS